MSLFRRRSHPPHHAARASQLPAWRTLAERAREQLVRLPPVAELRKVVRRELIWAEHERSREQLVESHPLRYLFFEVTRRCNLQCAYCGSGCSPAGQADELSLSEWIGVARQIADDFDPAAVMVAVTGGEPLIKPGVMELLEELDHLGFAHGLVSNGFPINQPTADRLVAAGARSLSLSMDAPPEINDALRGPGASAKVRSAVVALRRAGYAGKLEIISTITRPAVPFLPQMRAHVAELGVPLWRITPVMPIGRAASRPDLIPTAADIRSILEFVRAGRQDEGEPEPELCEEGYVGNRFEGKVRPYLCDCRAGVTVGSVLHDGKIGACPELGAAFTQGDIRQERFRDVWNTRFGVMRDRSWTQQGVCADCSHYGRCRGGSLHLYDHPGAELLRCLYLQAKRAEATRT